MIVPWRAADERWAARHMQILSELVMVFTLAAAHDSNFAQAVEAIPAWETASALVFDDRVISGATSASALLRELVASMQDAAERDAAVALLFSKKGWSAWSFARWAVADERQWERVSSEERPAGQSAPRSGTRRLGGTGTTKAESSR